MYNDVINLIYFDLTFAACLPDNELDGVEIAPGQTWSSAVFKYKCEYTDELTLAFDIIGIL